jgi:hypothetical protein
MAIREIKAVGPVVIITSDIDDVIGDYVRAERVVPQEVLAAKAGGATTWDNQTDPDEALLRAAGIMRNAEVDRDMVNGLMLAAKDAHKNMTGEDYTNEELAVIVQGAELQPFLKK